MKEKIPDEKQEETLHEAARKGDVVTMQRFLDRGARIDEPSGVLKLTALHHAAGRGHIDMVRVLLSRGANINVITTEDATALHCAAFTGRVDVIKMLLRHGADVNAPMADGGTPLHLAAQEGHTAVVVELLNHGAGANIVDAKGVTALHFATKDGRTDVVKVLLKYGASINVGDRRGHTPLHYAASDGRIEIANILLNHGADISMITVDGVTPLHSAADGGHVAITEMLLKRNASVNDIDVGRTTALHFAAEGGHIEIVKLLLIFGADPNIRTLPSEAAPEGESASDIAARVADSMLREELADELSGEAMKARTEKIEALSKVQTILSTTVEQRNTLQGLVAFDIAKRVLAGDFLTGIETIDQELMSLARSLPGSDGYVFGDFVRAVQSAMAHIVAANTEALTAATVPIATEVPAASPLASLHATPEVEIASTTAEARSFFTWMSDVIDGIQLITTQAKDALTAQLMQLIQASIESTTPGDESDGLIASRLFMLEVLDELGSVTSIMPGHPGNPPDPDDFGGGFGSCVPCNGSSCDAQDFHSSFAGANVSNSTYNDTDHGHALGHSM